MSHGHAFAVTNNIDQAFNHDNNGQPITSQDSNNNVDPGFNHDVDDNNDTDPGFNHDVIHNNDLLNTKLKIMTWVQWLLSKMV